MASTYKNSVIFHVETIIIFSFIINVLYALGNLFLGIVSFSYWYLTAGTYYIILSVMRFSVIMYKRKNKKASPSEYWIKKFVGIMLLLLSIVLSGASYLSIRFEIATVYHEIIMITISAYTFTKIVFAILNAVKARKQDIPAIKTIRNIALADAVVSIFSMQRSMLVSFGEMTTENIKLMNSLTATAVFITVAVLGISMIKKK